MCLYLSPNTMIPESQINVYISMEIYWTSNLIFVWLSAKLSKELQFQLQFLRSGQCLNYTFHSLFFSQIASTEDSNDTSIFENALVFPWWVYFNNFGSHISFARYLNFLYLILWFYVSKTLQVNPDFRHLSKFPKPCSLVFKNQLQ